MTAATLESLQIKISPFSHSQIEKKGSAATLIATFIHWRWFSQREPAVVYRVDQSSDHFDSNVDMAQL
jgi:hypothetical protein